MEKYKTKEPIEYCNTDIDYFEVKDDLMKQGFKETTAIFENGNCIDNFEKGNVSIAFDFGFYLGMTISTTIKNIEIKTSEIISHHADIKAFIDKALSQFKIIEKTLQGEN
jgi:hypothetical protein